MSDLVIAMVFLAFALFLVTGKYRPYAAIIGWAGMVLNLFLDVPAFVAEANFFYPALALLAVPFLAITVSRLLQKDPVVLRLSTTAAVATLIFVPFATIPVLRDGLVGIVVNLVVLILGALGHYPAMYAWDVITENGFYNQIIPGCTGILAISLMTGIIAGVPGPAPGQRLLAFLVTIPTLFILNIFRVAIVFIAVSDRWFAGFPDPTGTGDANFFWAHNVIAEALAIIVLLLFLAALCRILPGLYEYAGDAVRAYTGDIRAIIKQNNRT
jgi:archaeosortase A (PGF-CTERM-specific)